MTSATSRFTSIDDLDDSFATSALLHVADSSLAVWNVSSDVSLPVFGTVSGERRQAVGPSLLAASADPDTEGTVLDLDFTSFSVFVSIFCNDSTAVGTVLGTILPVKTLSWAKMILSTSCKRNAYTFVRDD